MPNWDHARHPVSRTPHSIASVSAMCENDRKQLTVHSRPGGRSLLAVEDMKVTDIEMRRDGGTTHSRSWIPNRQAITDFNRRLSCRRSCVACCCSWYTTTCISFMTDAIWNTPKELAIVVCNGFARMGRSPYKSFLPYMTDSCSAIRSISISTPPLYARCLRCEIVRRNAES
jgi:hypothetical protein